MVKNRSGAHEDTIREFRWARAAQVGAPLTEFEGVLTGVPRYVGGAGGLMRGQAADPADVRGKTDAVWSSSWPRPGATRRAPAGS